MVLFKNDYIWVSVFSVIILIYGKKSDIKFIHLQEDIKLFKVIFEHFYSSLIAFVYRHVGDAQASEDIVQEIFFKLYINLLEINPDIKVKSWLFQVARNSSIDYLRHLNIIDKHNFLLTEAMIHSHTVDKDVNEENFHRIYKALNSLPEQARIIIEKSIFEDKSYDEISSELNISKNTIKTHIYRSYKKLRDILSGNDFSVLLLFLKK